MQEEVSFKYRVECEAVDLLISASFVERYLPYPVLHITFCLLDINSKDKQPAW